MSVRVEDDGAGALTIGGARYLLIRPETLAAVQKAIETALGPRSAECLAAGGRAGGARATSSLSDAGEARIRRMIETGGAIGWGRFALERFSADAMVVTVDGSPFAEAYGPSPAPVCHLTRGVLESLAATTLRGSVTVIETACVAMGAAQCRFETVNAPRANRGGNGGDVSSPPLFT